jgi:hypothetical protein
LLEHGAWGGSGGDGTINRNFLMLLVGASIFAA